MKEKDCLIPYVTKKGYFVVLIERVSTDPLPENGVG